jgi:DtxR family Mn-dependent transcriptional regulator
MDMELSQTSVRYLLTIYELSDGGHPVRSVEIARALEVTPASVSHMLHALIKGRLVEKRYYGSVHLTSAGIQLANLYYTRRAMLESYFTDYLGVDARVAQIDAANCLCCLSEQSFGEIQRQLLADRTHLAAI